MSQGTRSEDYSSTYYNEAHLGGEGDYGWDSDHWRGFFRMVAERIIGAVAPTTVLDVGCAKGMLVQALREKGVAAEGFDLSDHAIDSAHPDARPHLRVASATDPIEGRWSLVTCIEVLEHMSPTDAQRAIDEITAVTDRVVFSSTPADFAEPTHVNVRPTASWASWFAERGFYRRNDIDMTFLSPWAVLFERSEPTPRELVQRYEAQLNLVIAEMLDKREGLLAAHREVSVLTQQVEANTSDQLTEQVQLVKEFEAEVLEARHTLLVNRDHVVGTEAEIGRLNRDVMQLTSKLQQATKRVSALERRKGSLLDKVEQLRTELGRARARNKALDGRVRELQQQAASQVSFTRKVARRLRGAGR